jgi:predicted PurR-regulated permease PerM
MVPVSTPPRRPALSPDQDAGPAAPDAVSTEVEDQAEMPLPSNPQTFFLGGLFALGALAAIYVASSIILPVVLAFVLKLLLQPAVRVLERVHLPRAVGALLPILLVFGVLAGLVAALSGPAESWAKRLPEGIPRLETHLKVLSGPIEALQNFIRQAEEATAAPGQKGSTIAVRQDFGLAGALFSGTRAVLDGLLTTVLVLYFLMVSEIPSFDAWSKSYRGSATSGKPSTSLSRSNRTSPPIW